MGKQGPCYHCGVTSTPLWRNGPPEKPVLCNACGSRWRTKGTLTNYTPLHSREPLDAEELKITKVKSISFKPKEQKLHKRKSNGDVEVEHEIADYDENALKVFEDTSNRSSSGSAISYSEGCSYLGGTDTNDLTGSAQSNVWDSLVPSRKRTCIPRYKPSPIEKLTKDLCSILHQQSSYFSGSSEVDLLYESETPMGSLEIGHGGVLIRHPNSMAVEEESEASSLPIDSKSAIVNEAYSGSSSLPVDTESKQRKTSNAGNEKVKRTQMAEEHIKRDKLSHEKFHILRSRDSPLSNIDMKDVIDFEGFMRHLTHEEQHQLMRYLPSIDATSPPESLRSMFHSTQFTDSLNDFQQLLLGGIFDLTFSEVDLDNLRTLKRLILVNPTKSKWVEYYRHIKDAKYKQIIGAKEVATATIFLGSSNSIPLKRPRDSQNQKFTVLKGLARSPKRSCKVGDLNLLSVKSPQLNLTKVGIKSVNNMDGYLENDGSCFSPRSFFASPPDRISMLDSLQFSDCSSDQALLLDVCSSAPLPEAELLSDPRKHKAGSNDLSAECGVESLSHHPSLSSSCHQPNHF